MVKCLWLSYGIIKDGDNVLPNSTLFLSLFNSGALCTRVSVYFYFQMSIECIAYFFILAFRPPHKFSTIFWCHFVWCVTDERESILRHIFVSNNYNDSCCSSPVPHSLQCFTMSCQRISVIWNQDKHRQ